MKRGNHGLDEKFIASLGDFYLVLLLNFLRTQNYVYKIFRKNNISYPLMRTRTCWYEGVRNNDFLENYLY